MTEFRYDHVHLRSPDPDATAAWYERMFGAEVIKSVMSNGLERTDMRLGGVMMFIAKVADEASLAEKAEGSYVGLDHIGLRVNRIDDVVATGSQRCRIHRRAEDHTPRGPHRLPARTAERADRAARSRRVTPAAYSAARAGAAWRRNAATSASASASVASKRQTNRPSVALRR